MLTLAADTIHELSRPAPSSEVVEYKTKDFLKTIEVIITSSTLNSMLVTVVTKNCLGLASLRPTQPKSKATRPGCVVAMASLVSEILVFDDTWKVMSKLNDSANCTRH